MQGLGKAEMYGHSSHKSRNVIFRKHLMSTAKPDIAGSKQDNLEIEHQSNAESQMLFVVQ